MIKRVSLILVAFATLAGLAYLADFELLVRVLEALPPQTLAMLIGVFLLGAILKGFRWAFYLRSARLDIRWRDGVTTYLAAMTTTPLPGGSWLAPRLAQEHGDIRMRQAAPALFVGFIIDAVTVPLLVLLLFIATDQPRYSAVVPAIGLGLGVVLFAMGRSKLIWQLVARLLARSRFTCRWLPQEQDIQLRVQALMRPKVLLGGIVFSIVATLFSAWFLMVLVTALTIRGISPEEALWVHSVAETASIALPIPGGFVTDSSTAGLLTQINIGLQRATFLALILRSMSIVFRLVLGSLVLFVRYDQFLLGVLDLRGRTRTAYRHAIRVPGLKQTLAPLVTAVQMRLARPIAAVIDSSPIEEASIGGD
jgi:hypothetical protein